MLVIQNKIKAILYASTGLTDLCGQRIYPDTPTTDTQLPFAIHWVTSSEPNDTLGGQTSLSKYVVSVECWAINLSSVLSILSAVKAALNGYRDADVNGSFLQSENTSPEDEGYHGQAVYNVWYTRA